MARKPIRPWEDQGYPQARRFSDIEDNFTEAFDRLDKAAPVGNGILVGNNGQIVGRSLLKGPGINIRYPLGIEGDPEISAQPARVLLAQMIGANLNVTTDQAFDVYGYNSYIVSEILVTNSSATPTSAAGGIYSATGKAGYTLVAAGQSYTALTDRSIVLPLTMGTLRKLTGPRIYLSLTTANGAACTADIYVYGYGFMD